MLKLKVGNLTTLSILITAAIVITTGFTRYVNPPSQVNAQFNIKDLPEYGLSIIGPSDPSYEGIVLTLFDKDPNPIIEAFRPFSIFIKNTSNRTMVGCLIKWEFMLPSGKVLTETRDYIALWSLTGTAITDKSEAVLRPNTVQFFMPSHLRVDQSVSSNGNKSSSTISPELVEYLKQRRSELDQFVNITVSLDGAFFDDGTYVGPDTAGFFSKVEATRNAKYDLLQDLEHKFQQRVNNNQIFQQVEVLANSPQIQLNPKSTPSDYYNSSKRDAALEILRAKAASGDSKAIEKSIQKLQKPWPALRKM